MQNQAVTTEKPGEMGETLTAADALCDAGFLAVAPVWIFPPPLMYNLSSTIFCFCLNLEVSHS